MDATRIDRIYTTKNVRARKRGLETVAAAFTDHLAMIPSLSIDVPILRRDRGFWKMNTSLPEEDIVKGTVRQQWAHWIRQRVYPHIPIWWRSYAKKMIRQFYIKEGSERRWDFMRRENFYYECIYDVLSTAQPYGVKRTQLNRLKAKITNLHSKRLQCVMFDNDDRNQLVGERPILFHVLHMRKRREERIIQHAQDEYGCNQRPSRKPLQHSCDGNMHQWRRMNSKYGTGGTEGFIREVDEPIGTVHLTRGSTHGREKRGRIKHTAVKVLG
jgi:hypothetical protein